MSERPRDPQGERFFGAGLMALGAIIAGLCGACTLAVAGDLAWSALRYPGGMGSLSILILPAVVGGLPTFAGVSLFLMGLRRYRGGRKPDARRIAKTFD
jgi:hypothetical protein